jgi:hypothetical protein
MPAKVVPRLRNTVVGSSKAKSAAGVCFRGPLPQRSVQYHGVIAPKRSPCRHRPFGGLDVLWHHNIILLCCPPTLRRPAASRFDLSFRPDVW